MESAELVNTALNLFSMLWWVGVGVYAWSLRVQEPERDLPWFLPPICYSLATLYGLIAALRLLTAYRMT